MEDADICAIGARLKAERERLGLTQPAFADAAGAKKRTLIDWEKGVSSPTAVQLSALATLGVDVLYVLTGDWATTQAPAPSLSEDEIALLALYRTAPTAGKAAAVGALRGAVAHKKAAKYSVEAERLEIGQLIHGPVRQDGLTINVGKKKK
ncbi:helix-turn-helix domain-containing protein [Pigmentiphaga kullae]|nr:helix-turn-helix domain-containing protein [Pigmentiphaga kullae]